MGTPNMERAARRALHRACAAVILLASWGCTRAEDAGYLTGRFPAATTAAVARLGPGDLPPGQTNLRFGVTPYLDAAVIQAQFQPVTAYLTRQLGVPVALDVAQSYEEQIERLVRGQVDIVSMSPLSYVLARERAPDLRIIAYELAAGATSFSSFIIVRSADPARSLRDLAGRSIAFVDPRSTSGYLFPCAAFMDEGLDPKRDLKPTFAGSHLAAIQALVRGEVDAAAVGSGMLAQAARHRGIDPDQVRILYKAGRIPYDAIVIRGAIPPPGADKIAAAFYALSTATPTGRAVLSQTAGISGWTATDDALYDQVRRVRMRVMNGRSR